MSYHYALSKKSLSSFLKGSQSILHTLCICAWDRHKSLYTIMTLFALITICACYPTGVRAINIHTVQLSDTPLWWGLWVEHPMFCLLSATTLCLPSWKCCNPSWAPIVLTLFSSLFSLFAVSSAMSEMWDTMALGPSMGSQNSSPCPSQWCLQAGHVDCQSTVA